MLLQGPTWAAVSDVHVAAGDVEPLVDETRDVVPPDKTIMWWIGPSCEPTGLFDQLTELGFVPPVDGTTVLHALASVTEPPAAQAGIEVREVLSFDEFVTATAVGWDAFAISAERRERERPHLQTTYDTRSESASRTFVAYVDGKAVGVGRSVYSDLGVFLIGGAVLEHARGLGVYRALVRARWDDAVARGTPGMITEAKPDTSYPILKQLGFVDVCTIRRVEDARS
ncbi:MAG TPA: GNAT family N-acetyltransferase [Gaiellaceae bacterium]